MDTRDVDDWTIKRWRTEPRFAALELDESTSDEQAPPLWKDLMIASIVALLLWLAAAAVFV